MSGDAHVRFCEGLGVKSPWATLQWTAGKPYLHFITRTAAQPASLEKDRFEAIIFPDQIQHYQIILQFRQRNRGYERLRVITSFPSHRLPPEHCAHLGGDACLGLDPVQSMGSSAVVTTRITFVNVDEIEKKQPSRAIDKITIVSN